MDPILILEAPLDYENHKKSTIDPDITVQNKIL